MPADGQAAIVVRGLTKRFGEVQAVAGIDFDVLDGEVFGFLGPNWAFETANWGRLTRRVPASQVVSAVPERQRRRRPQKPAKEPKTPPVVETLRRAIAWRQELDAGAVATQAAIARREGVTRARVTQVLMLLHLAPRVQKSILSLPESPNPRRLPESLLRPITRIQGATRQAAAFEDVTGYRL
jgi:ABC-type branched-subunit amino acid transport system ATPase component